MTEAMYLGTGVVDGVECERLAFRTSEVDWQIWIASGDKPYPCKYVVTSKQMSAAPQYQLRIRYWNDKPNVSSNGFLFKPSDDVEKVDLSKIENTDILMPERQ